jgi:hypothetical protein
LTKLATLTISFFGNCDDVPCCHGHHARSDSTGVLATET